MALESLKITAEYLGEGISNLAHGIYPETVVIGGNITSAWPIIEPIIKNDLRSATSSRPTRSRSDAASVEGPASTGPSRSLSRIASNPHRPSPIVRFNTDQHD